MGTLSDQEEAAPSAGQRWPSRPLLNHVVRILVVGLPVAASVAVGVGVSRLLPGPSGVLGTLARYALILVSSLAALVVADHFARRFLPLAVLLRLSLVFPDRAPSRLAVALNAGSPRRLASCLREGRDGDGDPDTILTLAAALNAHDRRTRGHSERVRALTELVAVELGLSDRETEQLRWAAFLHDIGKLRVPPAVLNKRGGLDPRERSTIRSHPEHGQELAEPLAPWLGEWIHAIRDHHEKYDGTGYPAGRAGTEISLAGRIVSVTDSFETMTAVRSYNRPMTPAEARRELARCAGTHFDPTVVRAFFAISLGRLRWTAGLAAWLAQLPLLGLTARAGAQVITTAAGIEASSGTLVGTAALAIAGAATPLTPAFVAAATWSTASAGQPAQAGALPPFGSWTPTVPTPPSAHGSVVPTAAAVTQVLSIPTTPTPAAVPTAPASSPPPVSDPPPKRSQPPPPPPNPPRENHDHPPFGNLGNGGGDHHGDQSSAGVQRRVVRPRAG
jgi:putative nucleotidyltransferase with HDIG domain